MSDHYQTLGVDPSANFAEIRAAHRAIMRQVHPDVAGPTATSTKRAADANEAWAILKNPRLRAAYDRSLTSPTAPVVEGAAPSSAPGVPSWGPGGIRPITVTQLREAAARERAYSDVGRRQRADFSAASRRIGIRIVGAGALLLALLIALVSVSG